MKKYILIISVLFIIPSLCKGQYDRSGLIFSAGTNYSKYFGQGEGNNYFRYDSPGIQLELTFNNGNGFEWIVWGFSNFKSVNVVGKSEVGVNFMSPYYTEFAWYKVGKKNPPFVFFGFDIVAMKFPNMEKPDYHYNIPFGAGWNLRLVDKIYLQFKVKPYFVLGNSIDQGFGVNTIANLHFNLSKN
jgi:hypothetical protein